jgi:hypothetical protein
MRKNLWDFIPRLRELGWSVWPDPEADFYPINGDDLMPLAEIGSLALKCAIRGWPIPPSPRRPGRAQPNSDRANKNPPSRNREG